MVLVWFCHFLGHSPPGLTSAVSRTSCGLVSHAAELFDEATEDVLAHMHFPKQHRRRLHSTDTNTLERFHMEIKRRTRVIGICPNRASPRAHSGNALREQMTSGRLQSAPLRLNRIHDQALRRGRRG